MNRRSSRLATPTPLCRMARALVSSRNRHARAAVRRSWWRPRWLTVNRLRRTEAPRERTPHPLSRNVHVVGRAFPRRQRARRSRPRRYPLRLRWQSARLPMRRAPRPRLDLIRQWSPPNPHRWAMSSAPLHGGRRQPPEAVTVDVAPMPIGAPSGNGHAMSAPTFDKTPGRDVATTISAAIVGTGSRRPRMALAPPMATTAVARTRRKRTFNRTAPRIPTISASPTSTLNPPKSSMTWPPSSRFQGIPGSNVLS